MITDNNKKHVMKAARTAARGASTHGCVLPAAHTVLGVPTPVLVSSIFFGVGRGGAVLRAVRYE